MLTRRDLLKTAGAAALGLGLGAFPLGYVAAADPAKKKRILFFTKSSGFEHSVIKRKAATELGHAEKILTELGQKNGFDVTCTKDGRLFIPEELEKYDAYFFYTTGDLTKEGTDKNPAMSAEGKKLFLDLIAKGKGFLGSHCASDTFHSAGKRDENQPREKLDPYIAMIGGEFIVHGAQQKAWMRATSKSFPGMKGVDDFQMHEEWYAMKNFAPDLHVILAEDNTGMTGAMYQRGLFPATWARKHAKGRVFYTSMGHREDVWTNATFQQILLGGISWALGNVEADVTPNIDKATPKASELVSS
jgi:hypothetical protein